MSLTGGAIAREVSDAYEMGRRHGAAEAREEAANLAIAMTKRILRPLGEALAGTAKEWLYEQDGGRYIRWGAVERAMQAELNGLAQKIREGGA